MPNTVTLSATDRGMRAAAGLLRQGGLVAFPTETVYGLGADARSPAAVAGIYAAKGRPSFNPLIVHITDPEAAARYGALGPAARVLADRFWPGPLTMVLPLRGTALAAAVTAGLPTVALRVPAHPLAHRLLADFGGPLAAPSANPSGRVSATTAAHVLDGLSGRIDAVLDGGACPVGIESTIVGFDGEAPVLLRPGGLAVEAIAEALGRAVLSREGAAITAPGQLASHYAPRASLRLGAEAPESGEVWIGFGPGGPEGAFNLSPAGDPAEAAANLFAHLRAADAVAGAAGIAVARIPDAGLGRAVNDRLARAAAPRG